MEYKDYYQTLGVSKDASDKAIKSAYRKLARKYHPDLNPDDKQAEEQFKALNEAYEVLSDPSKRAKYDQVGMDWQQWQQRGGGPGGYDWTRWTAGGPGFGGRAETAEDLGDVFGGGAFSDFFNQIFGEARGGRSGRQSRVQYQTRPQRGQDYQQEVEIALEEAYRGTVRILDKGGRRLEIKIPAGARTGTKVRISGEGSPGGYGGEPGDLYLAVKVRPDPRFERKGDDLHTIAQVDLYTALLGDSIRVATLSNPIMLTIKPETQNGQVLRLRGRGMPKLRAKDEYGDLYVKVDVRLPTKLTPHQQELLEQMRDAGQEQTTPAE
jgi:curved DNA-binding protein